MQFVQEKIDQFIDALSKKHGDEYMADIEVKHRGSGNIMLKRPHKEPEMITLDTLEVMTKSLRDSLR